MNTKQLRYQCRRTADIRYQHFIRRQTVEDLHIYGRNSQASNRFCGNRNYNLYNRVLRK